MTREGASPPPDGSYGCWSNTVGKAAVRPVAQLPVSTQDKLPRLARKILFQTLDGKNERLTTVMINLGIVDPTIR